MTTNENAEIEAMEQRLSEFTASYRHKCPKSIFDKNGAPTDKVKAFCWERRLSMDWLVLGDLPKKPAFAVRFRFASRPPLSRRAGIIPTR